MNEYKIKKVMLMYRFIVEKKKKTFACRCKNEHLHCSLTL